LSSPPSDVKDPSSRDSGMQIRGAGFWVFANDRWRPGFLWMQFVKSEFGIGKTPKADSKKTS